MNEQDLKDFSDFLKEFQGETDRGAALVGAALIDVKLERLLVSHFIDGAVSRSLVTGSNAPLGTLSSRIKASFALGLITELEYRECDNIRRIRNEFAHRVHGTSFQDLKLSAMCQNIKANTPDGARFNGNSRQLFINSVITILMSLWYRPEYTASIRAQSRKLHWEMVADTKRT